MKSGLKNILIGGTILLIGASFLLKNKIDETLSVFDKISIKPFSLPKKIKFLDNNILGIPQTINLNMDLIIKNPVVQSLSVSGLGIATLKNIDVFFKDNLIGTAHLELDEIEIPPQSNFILKDVNFSGNTLSILSNAEAFTKAQLSDFKFISRIEILGTTYEI